MDKQLIDGNSLTITAKPPKLTVGVICYLCEENSIEVEDIYSVSVFRMCDECKELWQALRKGCKKGVKIDLSSQIVVIKSETETKKR